MTSKMVQKETIRGHHELIIQSTVRFSGSYWNSADFGNSVDCPIIMFILIRESTWSPYGTEIELCLCEFFVQLDWKVSDSLNK